MLPFAYLNIAYFATLLCSFVLPNFKPRVEIETPEPMKIEQRKSMNKIGLLTFTFQGEKLEELIFEYKASN